MEDLEFIQEDSSSHDLTDSAALINQQKLPPVCDGSPQNMYNLSQLCIESKESFDAHDCKRKVDYEFLLTPAIIWLSFNIIIGIGGNALTLVAIPYAKRHKR